MTNYAIMDPTGQIPTLLGSAAVAPAGAVILPDTADLQALMVQMLTAGGWQPRPRIAAPLIVSNTVDLRDLPDGTLLEVWDVEACEMLASELIVGGQAVLALEVGVLWRIALHPPLPWLPLEIEVPA